MLNPCINIIYVLLCFIFTIILCFRLFKFINYIVSAPPILDQRILSSRGKSKRAWKRKSSGMFILLCFYFIFIIYGALGFLIVNLYFSIVYFELWFFVHGFRFELNNTFMAKIFRVLCFQIPNNNSLKN